MANSDFDNYHASLTGNEFQSTLLSIEEVEDRIRQLLAENSNLRNTLKQNNTYMKQLSVSLVEWQDEVARIQKSYSQKFEKARDLIQKLKNENSELTRKLHSHPMSLYGNLDASDVTEQEIHDLIPSSIFPESLNSFTLIEVPNMDKPSVTSSETDQDFCNPKEITFLHQNQTENEKDVKDNTKIVTLEIINKKLMQDIRELEEKMNLSNARLAKAEELVLTKQSKNTELEITVSLLEKQLETLPLLNTQVELFKNDFEAERDARQNLAGEKETMAQEIRLLRRKLETGPAVVSAATDVLEDEKVNTYECPKCSFAYSTMDSLNNHLDICLNQDMFP